MFQLPFFNYGYLKLIILVLALEITNNEKWLYIDYELEKKMFSKQFLQVHITVYMLFN